MRLPLTEDEAYDRFMQQELDDRVFGPVDEPKEPHETKDQHPASTQFAV